MCTLFTPGMDEPSTEYCATKRDGNNKSVDETGNYMTCFVSWMNTSEGVVQVSTSGCWLNDET